MEISAIKQRLSLSEVLKHYNLEPKNSMLKCFMHDDKTASLQVNVEKNFYKCHACGKTGDVIQFIEDYEKISKHEAIKKAKGLINPETQSQHINVEEERGTAIGQMETSAHFLEKVYLSFRKGIFNCVPAKEYVKSRALQLEDLEIGFNSGQLHYADRKNKDPKKREALIQKLTEVGLLSLAGTNSRTGGLAYKTFGIKSIVFPLKNKDNQIVSFYFRSIIDNNNSKHFYLKNRSGVYPNYPNPETKKLILTESIIDAASLLQLKIIHEKFSVLACFGTNGLNEEILNSIKSLPELEEIIFCFDNDKAGKEAVEKYAKFLKEHLPSKQMATIELPCKDVNETLQLHEETLFLELIEKRSSLFSSEENSSDLQHPIVENTGFSTEKVTRLNPVETQNSPTDFLQQNNLLQELNKLIEKAGIIGEEQSRLLLFLITISYLNRSPLHGIVQGSSGSGKTHIISRIADMMPQEDVLRFTRITESSLYNWGEFDLFQKIIIIEDLDGLKEDALYALREFISNQVLRSSVTIKDKKGNNKSSHKIVKGQFSSLSATTKGELYEDNMNRSFIVAVNESEQQTEKIISYQNRRNAGEIDKNGEEKAVSFIQKVIRNLKHYEVINPYATQIQLPSNVKNKRRLNEMFQSIIKQITIIYQYQREIKNDYLITEIEDIENAVEILFESIILKIDELDGSLRQFFEKLKKHFGEKNSLSDTDFTRFDAMEITGFKKTQLQFYLNELVRLEYLKQIGFANKGFKYKISYNDNIQRVRKELKDSFTKQLEQLKLNATEHKRTLNGNQTNTKT